MRFDSPEQQRCPQDLFRVEFPRRRPVDRVCARVRRRHQRQRHPQRHSCCLCHRLVSFRFRMNRPYRTIRLIRFHRFARPRSRASRRLPLPCPAKNSRSGSGVRAASVPLRGTRDAAFRAALKAVPQPAHRAAFVTALQNSVHRRVGQASPPVTRTTGRDACPTDSARPAKPTNALMN